MISIGLGFAVFLLVTLGYRAARNGRRDALRTLGQRAERELQYRRNRMSRIVHGAHDAWWEVDLVNQTAFSSDRWRGMAGVGPDQQRPGVCRRSIHPQDQERVLLQLMAQLADPGCASYLCHFRQVRRDGGSVPVQASGSIVRDSSGQALRIHGITVNSDDAVTWQKVSVQAASRLKPASARTPGLVAPAKARVAFAGDCGGRVNPFSMSRPRQAAGPDRIHWHGRPAAGSRDASARWRTD